MHTIAVFPGSFDPLTLGHVDIVLRSLSLFDEIIIAIGQNENKAPMFTVEQRMQWIKDVCKDYPQIRVTSYHGLTINFCKEAGATHLLRGIRTVIDLEFERTIAAMNKQLMPSLETVFLLTSPSYTGISSSMVRDVIRNNGDASPFLPDGIIIGK